MLPDRHGSSEKYRYGYQGSEKDDEVKGEGNSYTTHYRLLDSRVGRWLTKDPKSTSFESPYASMRNNPIFYNDVKGDTISYRGNRNDTEKIIKTYTDQLGAKNLKMNKILDSKGELAGVDIYNATTKIAKNGSDSLNKELVNVINSKENVRIFKVATTPNQVDNIEFYGGAMFSTDKKTIKEYTGSNKFKKYIFISDSYFRDFKGSGDPNSPKYSWFERTAWLSDDREKFRDIPFNEALFHETIHGSFNISGRNFASSFNDGGYYGEENAAISIMNKWAVQHRIHERGLWEHHQPALFGLMAPERWTTSPFTYDDFKGDDAIRYGDLRKDVAIPNKVD